MNPQGGSDAPNPQKPLSFPRSRSHIFDVGVEIGKAGHLCVVGDKERVGARRKQPLCNCPGDRHPLSVRRPPTELVDHDLSLVDLMFQMLPSVKENDLMEEERRDWCAHGNRSVGTTT